MTLPDDTTRPPWWERINYDPTPREMASWLDRTSDANRDEWFRRQRENNAQASVCWMHDHEQEIERLRRQLSEAYKRIAWLEEHYPPHPPYAPDAP